jgi:hypothetical protein
LWQADSLSKESSRLCIGLRAEKVAKIQRDAVPFKKYNNNNNNNNGIEKSTASTPRVPHMLLGTGL